MASTLPTEILTSEILPRLPAKTLLRFKSISKYFNSLISSPHFINLHLHYSLSSTTNTHLLLILAGNHGGQIISTPLPSLSTEDPTPTAIAHHFHRPNVVVSLLGSCHGLLCLEIRAHAFKSLLILNPTTCFSRPVPCSKLPGCPAQCYGFGFDPVALDYKIVVVVHYAKLKGVVVYSFNKNEWREIEFEDEANSILDDSVIVEKNCGVVINNRYVNFLFWCPVQNLHRIGCFDLCTEQWGDDVLLPEYYADKGFTSFTEMVVELHRDRIDDVLHMGLLGGCLCLLVANREPSVFDVWVMEEYGDEDSWVKLVSVPNSRLTRSLKVSPLAYCSGSREEILFMNSSGRELELFWYNVRDGSSRRVEMCGVSEYFRACVCEGTLVSIPGGERISVTPKRQRKRKWCK